MLEEHGGVKEFIERKDLPSIPDVFKFTLNDGTTLSISNSPDQLSFKWQDQAKTITRICDTHGKFYEGSRSNVSSADNECLIIDTQRTDTGETGGLVDICGL